MATENGLEDDNQRVFQEYWSLNGDYRLIQVSSSQSDWPSPVILDGDQDYFYTMSDTSEGADRRRLVLNVWVCEKGNLGHTYPNKLYRAL